MARKSVSSSAVNGNAHQADSAAKPREETEYEFDWSSPDYEIKTKTYPCDPSLLPDGNRSLSLIGLQAFFLGFVLAMCSMITGWLVSEKQPIWRLPAFFACLSLFHFLEYWTTARFNMPAVRASSFLLYSNGTAYNVAHTLASMEIIVSNYLPRYQAYWVSWHSVAIGLCMVMVGQVVRSTAMAQAGTNFNHTPAKTRKEGHELVTKGVYGWLRHPSYFGFFWWALGTQVLVGNKVCFVGYLLALWNFFNRRIRAEEITLLDFFGDDYVAFRRRTGTGIPFIR